MSSKALGLSVLLAVAGFVADTASVTCRTLPQQGASLNFDATVARPAYVKSHPKVLFDHTHNNADTSTGRYKPFSDLITSDGYRVAPNTGVLSKNALKGFRVLVIVNASGPSSQRDAAAFTEEESDAVRDWVREGGALLLICDHMPYSSALAGLASRFEVELSKGFTIDTIHHNKDANDETELVFTRDAGLLVDHPITKGRDATERISRVMSFSGTSLKGPAGSVQILKLSDTAKDVMPPPPDPKPRAPDDALPEHQPVSAAGRAQGIAFSFGQGRVVVLGEAAMLTAQVHPKGFSFGMNVSGIDNRQLALNIMHWLSGALK